MRPPRGLSEADVRAIFQLAGIEILNIKPLPDSYGYKPSDERYFETVPEQVWWFVKTKAGWVEIGWRWRVIEIFWPDTNVMVDVTTDDVTKNLSLVHAWSVEDALKYLRVLAPHWNQTLVPADARD